MAGTSYQMFEVLSFLQSGEVLTSFINDNSANFSGDKKYNEEFRVSIFWQYARKILKSNLVLVVVLVLESKGLYLVPPNTNLNIHITLTWGGRDEVQPPYACTYHKCGNSCANAFYVYACVTSEVWTVKIMNWIVYSKSYLKLTAARRLNLITERKSTELATAVR